MIAHVRLSASLSSQDLPGRPPLMGLAQLPAGQPRQGTSRVQIRARAGRRHEHGVHAASRNADHLLRRRDRHGRRQAGVPR